MNTKKIMPPTYLLISIVGMLGLHFLFPMTRIIPPPWNLLGIIPLALGVALNLNADSALHRAGTTVKPFEESSDLITSGVYRISRNPMYLGFVLILIGIFILLGTLSPCVAIPAFMICMDRGFIAGEEKMLAERFGAAWEAYKRETRRWL